MVRTVIICRIIPAISEVNFSRKNIMEKLYDMIDQAKIVIREKNDVIDELISKLDFQESEMERMMGDLAEY